MHIFKLATAPYSNVLWKIKNTNTTFMLVNGHREPTMTLIPGKWYRWRMGYVSIEPYTSLTFETTSGNAKCELQLLAKDGVYLPVCAMPLTYLCINLICTLTKRR